MPEAAITYSTTLKDEAATSRFGMAIGARLRAGDTLLLSGPIGAGKSHFARAVIGACLDAKEDIPSPTYTIVQTYESSKGEIWHADLYRLGDSSELVELGLDEAFGAAIVLVEWPDRLPLASVPADALQIDIQPKGTGRQFAAAFTNDRWMFLDEIFDDA